MDILFCQLSIDHNIGVQLVFSWAPNLARKCESKHWLPCGADRRSRDYHIFSDVHDEHVVIYTVLSESVLLGLRFIHNSVFSIPPTLCSDWNLSLAFRLLIMCTIYLARPEHISSRLLFYSSTSMCILKISRLYYGIILD